MQAEASGFLDGAAFNEGISRLRDTGLVYDLLIYAPQLEETIWFVGRHPKQSFVLDHVGKPSIGAGGLEPWRAQIRELALRPNVVCKVSGMVTETDWSRWTPEELAPYFDVVLHAFGANRLMIGTDWPVLTLGCSYSQWWQTVEAWIGSLSGEEKAAILGETAERIYHLAAEDAPVE